MLCGGRQPLSPLAEWGQPWLPLLAGGQAHGELLADADTG